MQAPQFTDTELDFVVGEAAPDAGNKEQLKRLVLEDAEFRSALVGDEKLFRRVMDDPEALVHLSPALYFEILLRRTYRDLEGASHTVERSGSDTVVVFDTKEVVGLLGEPGVLEYLADALASFTRIQSYVVPVRVRRGIRRRIRFNDMDIDSLMRLFDTSDEEQRFGLYKRIADVCLFISSMFVDYARGDHRYAVTGQLRPLAPGRVRRSLEDYEREGARFYGLAGEHPAAKTLDLNEVFRLLHQQFHTATKPLSFIARHYMHAGKNEFFGAPSS